MKGIDAMFDHGAAVGALKELDYVTRQLRAANSYGFSLESVLHQLKRRRKTMTKRLDQAARANCPPSPSEAQS